MNKTLKKNIDILNQNLSNLKKSYNIKRFGIFGSVAKGKAKRKSDIDILVEFSRPIGFFQFVELEENLEKLLNRSVDLVSKGGLKPTLKDTILKEVIYVGK